MGILSWIVVGAIAGFLANIIAGSREGLIMMVVLGVAGGLLGGFVASQVFHIGTVDGINIESIVISTVGALAIVLIANLATGSRGFRHGER